MAAKQRHMQRVRQRIQDKLRCIDQQEELLHTVVRDYVTKVKSVATGLLNIEDQRQFLEQYGDIISQLDTCHNTCELLTVSAEDMIDNARHGEADTNLGETILHAGETTLQEGSWIDSTVLVRTSTPEPAPGKDTVLHSALKEELPEIADVISSSSKVKTVEKPDVKVKSDEKESKEKCLVVPKPDVVEKVCVEKSRPRVGPMGDVSKDNTETLGQPTSVLMESGSGPGAMSEHTPPTMGEQTLGTMSEQTNAQQGKQKGKNKKAKNKKGSVPDEVKLKVNVFGGETSLDLSPASQSELVAETVGKTDTPSQLTSPRKKKKKSAKSDRSTDNLSVTSGLDESSSLSQETDKTGGLAARSETVMKGSEPVLSSSQSSADKSIDKSDSVTCVSAAESISGNLTDTSEASVAMETEESESSLAGPKVSQVSLPTGKMTPVILSDITSPWCFYVQPFGPQLNHLMEQICYYMTDHGLQESPLRQPKVGTLCLAQFSKDKAFYRAIVTRLHSPGDLVTEVDVIYVDYGNKEKVNMKQTRELPAIFTLLPTQAVCCSLSEVMPSNKYGVWREQDIFTFTSYTSNKQLTCMPVCRSSERNVPYLVQLFVNFPLPTVQSVLQPELLMTQLSIGQMLINKGAAKAVDVIEQTTLLLKYTAWDDELLSFNGHFDNNSMGVEITELHDSVETPRHGSSSQLGTASGASVKAAVGDSAGRQSKPVDAPGDTGSHPAADGDQRETSSGTGSECSDTESVGMLEVVSSRANTRGATTTVAELGRGTDLPDIKEESDTDGLDSESARAGVNRRATDSEPEMLPNESSSPTQLTADVSNTGMTHDPGMHQVMVSHINSPSDFYGHLISRHVGQTLDTLMSSLNQQFEKLSERRLQKLSRGFTPEINQLCCAQYTRDKFFYRALVLAVGKSTSSSSGEGSQGSDVDKIHVFYLDFGDNEWLSRHLLYPLPQEFTAVPALVLHCSLAFTKPRVSETENSETVAWETKAVEEFTALVGVDKRLTMHIIHGSLVVEDNGDFHASVDGAGDSPLEVLLVDYSGTEEVCINMEMIRIGAAMLDTAAKFSLPSRPADSSSLEAVKWNPMAEDFFSIRNSYKIDVDDPGVATTGYTPSSEPNVCKFFNKGSCWRGDRCPWRHVRGGTFDEEEVFSVSNNQQDFLPEVGSWVAMEISTILNPGRFYALLPMGSKSLDATAENQGTKPESSYCDATDDTETLDDLLQALNEEYSSKPFQATTLIPRAPGEIVAAQFSQDKQWYRARVLSVTEEQVKVFYLDFGNREWLDQKEIRDIQPQFLHLPYQAIECFLHNIETASDADTWTSEAKSHFRELVDGKTLVGHVKSRSFNGCLWVELYDTNGRADVNIGEELIKRGHAHKSSSASDSSTASISLSRRSSVESVILIPG